MQGWVSMQIRLNGHPHGVDWRTGHQGFAALAIQTDRHTGRRGLQPVIGSD